MKMRNERYTGVFFVLYCSLRSLGLAMVFFGVFMYCILFGGVGRVVGHIIHSWW
jgi:hypothetical protein